MIKVRRESQATRYFVLFTLAFVTSIGLCWGKAGIGNIPVSPIIGSQPASAQLIRSQDRWRQ
ncbi:MAG: hypothetical protein RLP02_31455, partial [Coleofasciculus sp. C2-GNP5-27]